jgi:hypothetical protein
LNTGKWPDPATLFPEMMWPIVFIVRPRQFVAFLADPVAGRSYSETAGKSHLSRLRSLRTALNLDSLPID